MRNLPTYKKLAACVLLAVMVVACVPPPPPMTHAVPNPGPGETVPLNWPHAPEAAHLNVAYGDKPHQLADVYLPTNGTNRGVFIAIHGGGFVAGTKDDVSNWFGSVMSQTERGFAVVAVSYGLTHANTNVFPTAVHDVSAAVRWVRNHGPDLGMNPDTVIVAGSSAGGTIAALVGTGWNSRLNGALGVTEPVDGWVSYAGMSDFVNAPRNVTDMGRQWLGPNANTPGWLAAASPVNHIDPLDPPGYWVHGDHDGIVPISQMETFVTRAAQSGITDRLYFDRVDTGGVDRTLGYDVPCRWHMPMCGANHSVFNSWVDAVVTRTL